jgi:hypothetical protein
MPGKKHTAPESRANTTQAASTQTDSTRKRWVKLTPRDHVLKQIEIQRELVNGLRAQLQKEEQTLQGMEKAKEYFPG